MTRPPVIKKQKNKHRFDPKKLNRGVVLLSCLPHGFFEKQIEAYFSQYGRVTRLRVARSEKTGNSKHYAFVEFKYPEVAQIAAESLNNYLMYKHLVKTKYIPPSAQKYDYFKQPVKFVKRKGTIELVTPTVNRAKEAVKRVNKPVTKEQHVERVERSQWK